MALEFIKLFKSDTPVTQVGSLGFFKLSTESSGGGGGGDLTFSRVLSENTPAQISAVANEIAYKGLTSAEVETNYGWKVGDSLPITLTTGETIQVRIDGYNHDTLSSDHVSKAGISWEMVNCLATKYQMNSTSTNAGGWASSLLRTETLPTIFDTLPQEWKNIIKLVDKKSANGGRQNYSETLILSENLFLLSEIEVFGVITYAQDGENEGSVYEYWEGKTNADRIKKYDSTNDGIPNSATSWFLRSCYKNGTSSFCGVYAGGDAGDVTPTSARGISFGFCT
jgi:hypothetical protein